MNGPEGGRMFAQGELEAINKGETIPVPDAIPEGEKAGDFQDEDDLVNRDLAPGDLKAINAGETIPEPDAIPEGEKAGNFQDEDEAEDDSVNRDLAPGDFSGAVAGEGQEPEELKKAA